MLEKRKIVILNQAANYLTVGFANAFAEKFDEVILVTGSVHAQGEELSGDVVVEKIARWQESPARKKMGSYLRALLMMWWLLMTKYRRYDVFFVSVPPMGYLLNLFLPHRFSMVIWDVYPDIFKITGMSESHWVYRLWTKLNRKSFRKAFMLFTISEKMAQLLSRYVDKEKIIVQPIWSIFQGDKRIPAKENVFIEKHGLQDKFIVQYSGNIGLTHNVEALVDIAEYLKTNDRILFQIIGRGPRKQHIEKLVANKALPNCMFLPFQSDDMFPYSLSAADLGVVILNEKVGQGSVPSKSYNLMSYGIPSLYIASRDSQLNLYTQRYSHGRCFENDEKERIAEFIRELADNKKVQAEMVRNSLRASKDFKRSNADRFVQYYVTNLI